MNYHLSDLQVFATPKAEAMFAVPGISDVVFQYPGTIRTVLFIHCGVVQASRVGREDYTTIVGRLYESADPKSTNENHVGKLYIDVHGKGQSRRIETMVERLEWHSDGSFDLITPDGTRRRVSDSSER